MRGRDVSDVATIVNYDDASSSLNLSTLDFISKQETNIKQIRGPLKDYCLLSKVNMLERCGQANSHMVGWIIQCTQIGTPLTFLTWPKVNMILVAPILALFQPRRLNLGWKPWVDVTLFGDNMRVWGLTWKIMYIIDHDMGMQEIICFISGH